MIKAVIIDFDDTLCLTEEACFLQENEALVRMGRAPMSREIHQKTWGKPLFDAIQLRSPGVDVEEYKRVFPSVHAEYIKNGRIDVVTEANLRTLDKIAKLDKQLIILTSRSYVEMKHLLDPTHHLAGRISAFYHKESSPYHKPDPRVFQIIEQKHGFRPAECVYVGDTPSDAAAAKGGGLGFIASLESGLNVKSDFSSYEVDRFIDKFTDLYDAVVALDAGPRKTGHKASKPKIILASQSPRRKDLLAKMGVDFEVIPSNFDEQLDDSRSTEEVAMELALGKASTVAREHPDCIVIGSDTIVTLNGRQLGKPRDEAEAREMLKQLGGSEHEVSTGLAVLWLEKGIEFCSAETAKVVFRPHDEQAVEEYLATGDAMDKAGAYGIQSGAAPLVNYIEGNPDTILGLPTSLLAEYLAQLGVKAKPVEVVTPIKRRKNN